MKALALTSTPQVFKSREFIELRNRWYRKLTKEGMLVDEAGFKRPGFERAPRAGLHITRSFVIRTDTDDESDVCAYSAHDHETAEYWRLIAEQVAQLPTNYCGRAFLVVWADRGEVLAACTTVRISRRQGAKLRDRFLDMLRRKRVLR